MNCPFRKQNNQLIVKLKKLCGHTEDFMVSYNIKVTDFILLQNKESETVCTSCQLNNTVLSLDTENIDKLICKIDKYNKLFLPMANFNQAINIGNAIAKRLELLMKERDITSPDENVDINLEKVFGKLPVDIMPWYYSLSMCDRSPVYPIPLCYIAAGPSIPTSNYKMSKKPPHIYYGR